MKSLNQYIEENVYNTPVLEASILNVGELENESDILMRIKDLINNEVIELAIGGGRTKEDDFNNFIKNSKIVGNTVNINRNLALIINIPDDPKFNLGFEIGKVENQIHYRIQCSKKHCEFPVKYLPKELVSGAYIRCENTKTIEFDLSKYPDKMKGNPNIYFENSGSQFITKFIWNTNPINYLSFGVKVKDDAIFSLPKIGELNPGKTGLNYFIKRALDPKIIKNIFGPNCEIEKLM